MLLSEFLKLVVACVLCIKEDGVANLFQGIVKNSKVLLLYMVPAFLYCLYNNLAFVNLKSYDPTTYFLLLQFRVVVTGVVFQIIFSKQLSRRQWFSLFLLTAGCILKQLDVSAATGMPKLSITINLSLGLILVQIFCSCFAGVYNEYLLKGNGHDVPFMLQNVFMYGNSILCNVVILAYTGHLQTALKAENIDSILQMKVLMIIINNAAIGLVTAMFLRSLNSILKTFASALELMFTAILSWIIFGIPVNILTAVAIGIVSYATLFYAQNPVDNTPPSAGTNNDGPNKV